MEIGWDKKLCRELIISLQIDFEKAMKIIGIVAEHRQIADITGYKRGYNSGYEDGQQKAGKNIVRPD